MTQGVLQGVPDPLDGSADGFLSMQLNGTAKVLGFDDKVDKNGTDRLMTEEEGDKLDKIESGAEANVKPDWDAAEEGVAGILNKPGTFSSATRTVPGLVPAGAGSGATKYLREDATWVTPPDTDTHSPVYSDEDRTVPGLVPAGSGDGVTKFLREDGTWKEVVVDSGGDSGGDGVSHLFADDEDSAKGMSEEDPDALVFFPDEGGSAGGSTGSMPEVFDQDSDGLVPAPGESSSRFLRDDATWQEVAVPEPDLSNYYTKSEIDDSLRNKSNIGWFVYPMAELSSYTSFAGDGETILRYDFSNGDLWRWIQRGTAVSCSVLFSSLGGDTASLVFQKNGSLDYTLSFLAGESVVLYDNNNIYSKGYLRLPRRLTSCGAVGSSDGGATFIAVFSSIKLEMVHSIFADLYDLVGN
jgi:hypothetical protein